MGPIEEPRPQADTREVIILGSHEWIETEVFPSVLSYAQSLVETTAKPKNPARKVIPKGELQGTSDKDLS